MAYAFGALGERSIIAEPFAAFALGWIHGGDNAEWVS